MLLFPAATRDIPLLQKNSTPTGGFNKCSNQLISGTLCPDIKWQKQEAKHSPPFNAEVKRQYSYKPTPP